MSREKYYYDTGVRNDACLERFAPVYGPDDYTFSTEEDVNRCKKYDSECSGTFTSFRVAREYALFKAERALRWAQKDYDELIAIKTPADVPIETDPYH